MPRLSFILNGDRVEVDAGTTILDAARRSGVKIPTLCHDPRLKPTAACRLCMVEVAGARGPVPACATEVTEGMVVKTNTEDLIALRRTALELLLSDHYGDCVAPCQLTCPAGIDIQGYIALVANGQYQEALRLIKQSNPLPLVVGRVCPRFCEKKCRRNLLEGPVYINALKRFVADHELGNGSDGTPEPRPDTGHRVAIVGGGPAGLSAAYYLALEGHRVTILEAGPKLGGMLRYGIPEYRLPKAILDREIAGITRLCREIRCNTALGRDFTLSALKKEEFEAIFVAMGTQAGQKMGARGEDLPGVLSGIAFLRDLALGKKSGLGHRVVVIGGGNTAMDAARTALRLGAGDVTIVYRRSRDEMPANKEEIEQAEQEGVKFQFLAAPVEVKAENGRVTSIECVRMSLGEPDSSGRRRPEPIKGSEFTTKAETVLAAIGQVLDTASLKESDLKLNSRKTISVNEETMATSLPGIFAGGDCTSGAATVVEAVAAGRRAAVSISQYLGGKTVTGPPKPYNCTKGELDKIDPKDYAGTPTVHRTEMPALPPETRKLDFAEIETGFSETMARAEAERCLSCGCQDVFECKLRELANEYAVADNRYAGRRHRLPQRTAEHPHILRESNKCILCGRCVRLCDEVAGIRALGFVNRGFETVVEPALGMPLSETACESCGQCISTCPTGALTPRTPLPKPGPWRLKPVPSVCPYCGVGCNIELNTIGNEIVTVTSPLDGPVNGGNLCKKAAFDIAARARNAKRLKTPLVNRDGRLVEVSWNEGISLAGQGLNRIKERSGADELAVLSSPRLTNEESYLVQKLARAALGTNSITSLSAPTGASSLTRNLGRNASTASFGDILTSDLVIVFECDIGKDYPVAATKVRQAINRGSKLITLGPRVTSLDCLAGMALRANQRTSVDILVAMLSYIVTYDLADRGFVDSCTTGFEDFAQEMRRYPLEGFAEMPWVNLSRIVDATHLFIRARRPVIIVNAANVTPVELGLLSDLALLTGNVGQGAGILLLQTPGNAQGIMDMGVHPEYLPGQQPLANASVRREFEAVWDRPMPRAKGRDFIKIVQDAELGKISGLLVVGGDATGEMGSAIFEVPLFSVLVDTVVPEKPPYPSVILPGADFAESDGTYTNCERRLQRLYQAVTPFAGWQNWEIISAIATAAGYPMRYSSVSAIHEEIEALVPLYRGLADGEQWPFLKAGRFNCEDGLARVRLPELDSLEFGPSYGTRAQIAP